jgi:zinc protease
MIFLMSGHPRKRTLGRSAVAALLLTSPAVARAHSRDAMTEVATYRLDNGTSVIVAPNSSSNMVAVQAWIGAGAADEPLQCGGVAHAVEHMLFKGSSGYAVGELTKSISAVGGEINAWTAFDHTVLHAVGPAHGFDTMLDGIADTLNSPHLSSHEFALEKRVIIEEFRQGTEVPMRMAMHGMFATAFTKHPYRRPVIGSEQSIAGLTIRHVVDFYRQWYVGSNVALVVAGAVDPDDVVRRCSKRFRSMPAGQVQRNRTVEPKQQGLRSIAMQADVDRGYVAVGFHSPALRHRDFAALDVAALVLGQRNGAHLTGRLRAKSSAATSAFAQLHATREPGLFAISAQTAAVDVARIVDGIVSEIVELAATISDDDIDVAKTAIESDRARQFETVFGQARTLGWNASTVGDAEFHLTSLDRVRRLRRSDVVSSIAKYLTADQASVSAVFPHNAQQARKKFTAQVARSVARLGNVASSHNGVKAAAAPSAEVRVELASGVVLLLRRDPSVPVVAMRAVWRGGSRLETEDNNGINAVIARMLSLGCGTFRRAELARKFERLGGGVMGVAGRNSMSVAGEFLAVNWREGFELFSQCLTAPRFDRDDVDSVVAAMVSDLEQHETTGAQIAYRNFADALFRSHPYRFDVAGQSSSVKSIRKAAVSDFFRDVYATAPLTIAIVGDIDLAQAKLLVAKRFAEVKRVEPVPPVLATPQSRKLPRPVAAPVVDSKPRELYTYQPRDNASLVIGFAGTRVSSPDRFAVEVLVAALAGQSGRLFSELREKSALVYRVSAHSIEGIDPGFIAVSLSCSPEHVDQVVDKIHSEFDKLVSDGLSEQELQRLKQSLIGMQSAHLQRRAAVASAMAFHEAYGLPWQQWQQYDRDVTAVTREQVQQAARSYLDWNRSVISVVRPPTETPGAQRKTNGKNIKPPMKRAR